MKKFLVVLDEACLKIAATLFFIIFVVSIVEIILRSFFGFSLLWTKDLCTLLGSWTILIAADSTLHRADHLCGISGEQVIRETTIINCARASCFSSSWCC